MLYGGGAFQTPPLLTPPSLGFQKVLSRRMGHHQRTAVRVASNSLACQSWGLCRSKQLGSWLMTLR